MKRLFLCLLFLGLIGSAAPVAADDYEVAARSAIAVDATSGKILYEKEANQPIEIGSITNLLTVYLVYEAIDQGKLTLDTYVDISDYAYSLNFTSAAVNLPMENRRYKVKDLIEASLLASASSASVALAEKIGGSEEKFVAMMKAKLKEWGIEDAALANASGLNPQALEGQNTDGEAAASKRQTSEENKLSAYDLAVIARHLITEFPQVTDITSKTRGSFAGIELDNYNYMLEGQPNFRSGVDGLKTGSSEKGGSSFVATTTQKGIRLITVVLDVTESDGDPYARFVATASLMNFVSQNYTQTLLVKQGDRYEKSRATVIDGKQNTVSAVAGRDFTIIERIGNQAEHKLTFTTDEKGYQAPLKKNSEVGSLTYTDPEPIGQGYLENKQPSVPMVADQAVEKSIFFKVWWNEFVRYVNEKL